MPLDVNDPAFMPLYERQKRALEEAFEAGLKLHGCVECARVDLAQRLRLMARAAEQEIIGPQGEEGAPVPEERSGIRRRLFLDARGVGACSHFSCQASSRARCEVALCFNRFHRPAL